MYGVLFIRPLLQCSTMAMSDEYITNCASLFFLGGGVDGVGTGTIGVAEFLYLA